MKKKTCLFLTATINPGKSVPSLKRINPYDRERDYLEAINVWIKHGLPIVFCENSAVRSESIIHILQRSGVKFEYLCFQSTESHRGKGNGEFEIFEHAFKYSEIIKESQYIIKVTGRYSVRNFGILYQNIQNDQAYIKVNLSRNLTWADSRFFCFERDFWYEIFHKFSSSMDESNGILFENLLAKATLLAIIQDCKWSSTSSIPWLKGIYGTGNTKYKNSYTHFLLKNIFFKAKRYLMFRSGF